MLHPCIPIQCPLKTSFKWSLTNTVLCSGAPFCILLQIDILSNHQWNFIHIIWKFWFQKLQTDMRCLLNFLWICMVKKNLSSNIPHHTLSERLVARLHSLFLAFALDLNEFCKVVVCFGWDFQQSKIRIFFYISKKKIHYFFNYKKNYYKSNFAST